MRKMLRSKFSPTFLEGNYHFMITLTKTFDSDHFIRIHKSIMAVSPNLYISEKELLKVVTDKIQANIDSFCDFTYLELDKGNWEVSLNIIITDIITLHAIQTECSYTEIVLV